MCHHYKCFWDINLQSLHNPTVVIWDVRLGHPLHPSPSSATLTHASLGQQPVTSNSHLMIDPSQVQSTLHDYSLHFMTTVNTASSFIGAAPNGFH